MIDKNKLNNEINYINNKELRRFLIDFLNNYAPEYFWSIPAASSGKYHPEDTRGPSGLIVHIKYAVQIARTLFKYIGFSNKEKDTIIAALILHDCFKLGYESSSNKYTTHAHPIICQDEILEWLEFNDYSDEPIVRDLSTRKQISEIANLVGTHMGNFTTGSEFAKKYNKEAYFNLRSPNDGFEIFTHLCDYISSKLHLLNDDTITELSDVSELIGITGDQLESCWSEFMNINK